MKRILTLDFLRGLSIFCMTGFHVWLVLDNMQSINPANGNYLMMVIGMLFFILGHWRGFFLLISAASHVYAFDTAVKHGKNPNLLLGRYLIAGFLLYLVGCLRESVFSHWGFLGYSYMKREWAVSELSSVFYFETLQMIGVSIIIVTIIEYFLVKKEGMHKIKRNIIIYAVLALIFISLEDVIHNWVDGVFSANFEEIQREVGSIGEGFARLFWVMLAGREEPIFPFLGSTFIGCIIGILLSQEKLSKKILRYGFILGGAFILAGVVMIVVGAFVTHTVELSFAIFQIHIHPPWFYLLNTGLQLIVISAMFWWVECNPKLKNKRFIRNSRYIRRWGMVSLTVYFFQIFDVIPREILYRLTGEPFYQFNQMTSLVVFGVMALVIAMWEGIIRLWEWGHFIGTWEWLLGSVQNLTNKPKLKAREIMRIQEILYDVEPVQFLPVPLATPEDTPT